MNELLRLITIDLHTFTLWNAIKLEHSLCSCSCVRWFFPLSGQCINFSFNFFAITHACCSDNVNNQLQSMELISPSWRVKFNSLSVLHPINPFATSAITLSFHMELCARRKRNYYPHFQLEWQFFSILIHYLKFSSPLTTSFMIWLH